MDTFASARVLLPGWGSMSDMDSGGIRGVAVHVVSTAVVKGVHMAGMGNRYSAETLSAPALVKCVLRHSTLLRLA